MILCARCKTAKFSNIAFQIDMKILSGDGGGLTLRGDTQAGNNYYFHVFPDGLYHLYIYQNHALTTQLASGSANSFKRGTNQVNTLTAVLQGKHLYLYINQEFLTVVEDSTYTNGYLGVLATSGDTQGEEIYTNMKIWQL